MITTIHFSGLNTQACCTSRFIGALSLHPALPPTAGLQVLPVDFANELLAKLCSCGTSADPATQLRSKLRNEIYC